jgi:hypothetical protein
MNTSLNSESPLRWTEEPRKKHSLLEDLSRKAVAEKSNFWETLKSRYDFNRARKTQKSIPGWRTAKVGRVQNCRAAACAYICLTISM